LRRLQLAIAEMAAPAVTDRCVAKLDAAAARFTKRQMLRGRGSSPGTASRSSASS